MSSFFTKLYRVRKNSEEDYLTALFADVLEEVKTVGEEYIKFLCKKGGIELPTGNGIDEKFLFGSHTLNLKDAGEESILEYPVTIIQVLNPLHTKPINPSINCFCFSVK